MAALFNTPSKPVTPTAFTGKPLAKPVSELCAPRVAEQLALDASREAREAGKRTVLAASQDLDPAKAAAYWQKRGLTALALCTDPEVKLSTAYTANLPTTVLYDSSGKEVVRVAGGMDWAGPEAAALIAKGR